MKDDPINCVSFFFLDTLVGDCYCCGIIGTGEECFALGLLLNLEGALQRVAQKKAKIETLRYFIQAPDTGRTVYSAYLEPSLEKVISETKLAYFL